MTACALALVVAPYAAPAEPTSPEVIVRTVAGSGAAGVEDGDRGSFMAPYGIAYGPHGVLYVSDAIGQRIREVTPAGRITTIAGGGPLVDKGLWVRGGYRDGKGSDALFNRPAGLAWSGGRLYVADTNNHCIRVIAADGTVSTFAGSPQRQGVLDGPLSSASFLLPSGIAADRAGTLYVADYFGVRTIRDGVVRTIPNFGANGPWSVAVADTPQGTVVFAAGASGIDRMAADGTIDRYTSNSDAPLAHRNVEGLEPLGYPAGIGAIDQYSIVYTDLRENTVRYLDWYAGSPQVLGGSDVYDGASSAAGWSDGKGDASRFDAPMGVAIGPDHEVAIADMGNRRVRLLTNLDLSHVKLPAGYNEAPQRSPNELRVAFVGNSAVWTYTRWGDGIPGIVERRLRADPAFAKTGRRVLVVPYVFPASPLSAEEEYIENLIAETRAANLVILNLNTVGLYLLGGLSLRPTDAEIIEKGPQWSAVVTAYLRAIDAACKRNGARFVVYTTPVAENVSPTEGSWGRLESEPAFAEPSVAIGDLMNNAVRASGVTYLDGWSVLETEFRSPGHVSLFGTQDLHFSPHGRAVIANALADFLMSRKPWTQ